MNWGLEVGEKKKRAFILQKMALLRAKIAHRAFGLVLYVTRNQEILVKVPFIIRLTPILPYW